MSHAWKELTFYKKKYLLIELLIIVMMFMVVFLSGLANGLGRAVSAAIENNPAQTYILNEGAEQVITSSVLTTKDQTDLNSLNLKDSTTLNIQRSSLTRQGHEKKIDISYFAIDKDSFMAPTLSEGKQLTSYKKAIILNDSLKAEGIKLGDKVIDKSSSISLTVVGFVHNSMYGHGPVAFIDKDIYTEINKKINPQYQFLPQALVMKNDKSISHLPTQLEAVSKKDVIQHIPGYSAEQSTLNMILWVLVVASAGILGVFFYIITLQKRHEFSVMKAIGTKMSEIALFQLSQVIILALFGIIVGDGLAISLSYVLPDQMPFVINWQNIILVSFVFLVIAMISSALSIVKVAKIDPVEVINGGGE
ncbi:TPA: ABC transporter permease [Streptococcus agalactiae]